MSYQSSTAPIPESELKQIPCFRYINPDVAEKDLEQWDQWFMRFQSAPEVYSIRAPNGDHSFYIKLPSGGEVFVDWRVYRTWQNSLHLRYKTMFHQLGLPAKNPHIHPGTRLAISRLMDSGLRPCSLAEALADARHCAA